jgi:hypothetical protein
MYVESSPDLQNSTYSLRKFIRLAIDGETFSFWLNLAHYSPSDFNISPSRPYPNRILDTIREDKGGGGCKDLGNL